MPDPFARILTDEERTILYDLLRRTDAALARRSVRYSLCWGAMLGLVRFGELMPWDDDIDLLAEGPLPVEALRKELPDLVLDDSGPYLKIHRPGKRFPFLEINPGVVDGDVIRTKSAFNLPDDQFPLGLVFPAQRTTFGGVECSIPADPIGLAKFKYGSQCLTHAKPPFWDHRRERETGYPQERVPIADIVVR